VILHPSMPVIGRFDHTIDALGGTQASVYVDDHLVDRGYAFESMSADPAYAALMSPGPAMNTLRMVRSYEIWAASESCSSIRCLLRIGSCWKKMANRAFATSSPRQIRDDFARALRRRSA